MNSTNNRQSKTGIDYQQKLATKALKRMEKNWCYNLLKDLMYNCFLENQNIQKINNITETYHLAVNSVLESG